MKKHCLLSTLIGILMLTSCKQSDFYEKEYLDGVAIPNKDEMTNPSLESPTNPTSLDQTNPTGGQNTTDNGSVNTPGPIQNQGNDIINVPLPIPTNNPEVVIIQPSPLPSSIPTPLPTATMSPTDPSVKLENKVEKFVQQQSQSNADLDILWVIDDSGSMADEQEALAFNFQGFISEFLDRNVNFQMAITTTDGTHRRNGTMVGDAAQLTSIEASKNKDKFIKQFTQWVKVGTQGSGKEQGLKCANSFIDKYGDRFLRKDAFLSVIILSDEEDQSEESVDHYLQNIKARKTHEGQVKVYSIVTKNKAMNQWESIGSRYIEASQKTAGVSQDIHQEFYKTLSQIGSSMLRLIDSFALATSPYNNQIKVLVNGVEQKTGHTFDPLTRTLKFDAAHVPSVGSTIEIQYQVQTSQTIAGVN